MHIVDTFSISELYSFDNQWFFQYTITCQDTIWKDTDMSSMWIRDIFYPFKDGRKTVNFGIRRPCSTIIGGYRKRLMDPRRRKRSKDIERWTCISTGEKTQYKIWKSEAKYNWKECVKQAVNIFWSPVLKISVYETLPWCHAY